MTDIVGIVHPGDMGSTVGAAAAANVRSVIWASSGRSPRTVARAVAAELVDVNTLEQLVHQSDVVVSVCPPHAAEEMARQVAALGYGGVYLDANAISPQRGLRIAAIMEESGVTFVDGGIVGGPTRVRGRTRLYLSGTEAHIASQCFAQGPLEAIVIEGPVGAASALKMGYAAYTKGTSALTASILAMVTHNGVRDALLREWGLSHPGLTERAFSDVRRNALKAWRFVGEMDEIAATFIDAGLPGGFHEAAAELYRRLASHADEPEPPAAEDLLLELLNRGPS